ncbi:DUF4294 domain-containing protein [Prevotella nigrescens]|jgi:hypothetical protein|uniref:DUF4294 domain-containing protein n=1 Tax=Prevotella nigrescens TaxID=28133 RepID=A0A9D5WXY6_9BACT|nr:DUF4294 domain-containing protein [Prevotella nigrescens]EGQ14550.1 hypothetical protein HMPREF9419_1261 [Prevotella nigrescens ATCC 33563]ELX66070.1 hypothetical protein HMPREF0662_02678 [Prevotella nigrescens F0103]MBF1446890.1 DUF4294 domain-containing protein [Prevotella nigrescens]OWP29719.1 hypothetical protein CBG57_00315 [Prevotella nigrescens]QUB53999.1 DUF4294 domain-containing protein [Prevotella nigrescens F0103]
MRGYQIIFTLLFLFVSTNVFAQEHINPEDRVVDLNSPTFVPMVHIGKAKVGQDSVQYVRTNTIYIYPPMEFKNDKQRQAYNRLVYNIKKVLPLAKECNQIILETGAYLQTIPTKKERDALTKAVEKELKQKYTPRIKKLTYSQGKLLIKLIDRETHSTGYELIQAFLGPVRAGFYQAFAWVFGASLKKRYDPKGADRLVERIVSQVEAGQL